MKTYLTAFLTIFCVFLSNISWSQPQNDSCQNADIINITGSGYDLGSFISTKYDISDATREIGESCSPNLANIGNCSKTVWYSFYIPTTRDVEVVLKQQDSAIPQIFAGFTIYKAENCNYNSGNISSKLVPLSKFGASGNECLTRGYYYVQVAAKNKAKGVLWLQLNVDKSNASQSDEMLTPHDFGTIDGEQGANINLECNSVTTEEATNIGNSDFSKSMWFQFKILSSAMYKYCSIFGDGIYGYRIFKGLPNEDSLSSSKPFVFSTERYKRLIILEELCEDNNNSEEYFVQVITQNNTNNVGIALHGEIEIKDDWNSPETPGTVHHFVFEVTH
jgi:hypothetical protein